MRFIIDTNILISALIKDSITRKILLSPKLKFYLPKYLLNEISKYIPEISEKANQGIEIIKKILNILLENFFIVPFSVYKPNLKKAIDIMRDIDEKDVQFIALALSIKNDGIWTNDKHFKKQNAIKILTTYDITILLKFS